MEGHLGILYPLIPSELHKCRIVCCRTQNRGLVGFWAARNSLLDTFGPGQCLEGGHCWRPSAWWATIPEANRSNVCSICWMVGASGAGRSSGACRHRRDCAMAAGRVTGRVKESERTVFAVMAGPRTPSWGCQKTLVGSSKVCHTPTNLNVPCDTPPTVPDALISSKEETRAWLPHGASPQPLCSPV
jgi:hypothetical protein